MFVRYGLSWSLVIVSVCVLLVITPAKAECDCEKPDSENTRTGVDKFFHSTLCGVKGAAKTVGEKVKGGYNYVKNKLSPETTTPATVQLATYDIDLRSGVDGGDQPAPVQLAN